MVLYWEGAETLGGAAFLEDVGGSLEEGLEHHSPTSLPVASLTPCGCSVVEPLPLLNCFLPGIWSQK